MIFGRLATFCHFFVKGSTTCNLLSFNCPKICPEIFNRKIVNYLQLSAIAFKKQWSIIFLVSWLRWLIIIKFSKIIKMTKNISCGPFCLLSEKLVNFVNLQLIWYFLWKIGRNQKKGSIMDRVSWTSNLNTFNFFRRLSTVENSIKF